jgi:predicted ATPase
VGPGGVGKTRLALQVGADLLAVFPDGVFFVSLVSIDRADLIPAVISSSLQIPLSATNDLKSQLYEALANKELLLILDNLEHLHGETEFIAELLSHALRLTILATSRERLKLDGEWVYPVDGLPTCRSDAPSLRAVSIASDLFIQSARRLQPAFQPDLAQQEAIEQACWLLGGLPLAIELAASWVHVLPCTEIAQEIRRDVDFLEESRPDRPPRHANMRSVFNQSWSLLLPEEQAVFRKLSVFRGGFQRDAAEHVAGAALPQLRSLMDKSLIKRTPFDRYDLHDLARQYAYQQLIAAGEEDAVRDQALRYYLNLVQIAAPMIEGEHGPEWLERLEEERDNIRAALEWSLSSGQIESGLNLAWALYRFWYWRNQHAREGRYWLEALLAAAESLTTLPSNLLGNVQYEAGVIASMLKDFQLAIDHFTRSLAIRKAIGDKEGQSAVINSLGTIAFEQQDLTKARAMFEESLALRLELGLNPAVRLYNLGMIAFFQGDYLKAREYLERSLQINRETNNSASIASDICSLAGVELRQGDRRRAKAHFLECLWLRREVDDNEGIAYSLEGLATYYACGEPGEVNPYLAAQLFGAAESLRRAIAIPLSQVELDENRRFFDSARTFLGEETFNQAWQEGRVAHIDKLVQEILKDYIPEKISTNDIVLPL